LNFDENAVAGSLDFHNMPNLQYIDGSDNLITSVSFSGTPALEGVNFSDNQIQ